MTERKDKDIKASLISLLADNNQGDISAADIRSNLLDMVDSVIPIMGSGASQTPFFNGPSGIHFRDNSVGTNDTVFNYIYGNWNRNKVSAIGFGTGSDTTNKDDGSLCFYTAASGVTSSTGGHGIVKRLQIQSNGEVDVYASGIGNVGLHVQSITPKRSTVKDPLLLLLQSSNNSIGAVSGEKINMGQWDAVNKTLHPTLTIHESGQVMISREGKGVGMNPIPAVSGIHYGWAELQLINTHHMNQPNNFNHSIGSRMLFKGHKDQWDQSNHPSGQAQNLFAVGTDVYANNYNTEDKNNFFIQDVYTSGSPVRLFINRWGNTGIDVVKPSGKMHVHARGASLSTVGLNNPASGVAMTLSAENADTLFDLRIRERVNSAQSVATFTAPDADMEGNEGRARADMQFSATAFDDSNDETITLIDTAGTSKTYTIKNDYSGVDASQEFNAGSSRETAAENLAALVESSNGHNGTIIVYDSSSNKFSSGSYDFSDGIMRFTQAVFSSTGDDLSTISHSSGWDALTDDNLPDAFEEENRLVITDANGVSLKLYCNSDVAYNASTATAIGTSSADSTTRVAEAVWRALDAARIAGTINITLSANPGLSLASSFTVTQVAYGLSGNTTVTGGLISDGTITVSGFAGGSLGNGDALEFSTREPRHNRILGISTVGHVGIGTLAPIDMLHVDHDSTAPSGVTISNMHGRSYKIFSGHSQGTVGSGQLVIQDFYGNNSPTRLAVGPSGNIAIGTNVMPVPGTSTKALVFGDNSAHAKAFDGSSGNNTAGIYAKDTGGTVKLYAFDEGNNQTTLSPHVFKYFESPDPMAWSFYSRNEDVGEEINVDMFGAIQALEEITGKKFIHKRKLNGD